MGRAGSAQCPEAVAAILREMRDRAITKIGGRTITERNFVPQETVEDWADRIEAAESAPCPWIVAAILREMRDKAAEADGELVAGAAAWFRAFADRIEAVVSAPCPEAVAAILREMRDKAAEADGKLVAGAAAWFRAFADRIEAAVSTPCPKMHTSPAPTRNCDAPGNAAAMREALERIRSEMLKDSDMGPTTSFHAVIDELTQDALSAQARNCDVLSCDAAKRASCFTNTDRSEPHGKMTS